MYLDGAKHFANKIKIKTNYGIELDYTNMHIPYAYELFDTNMTNIVPTSNNQSFNIGNYIFTNKKYTLMFLQLGYSGVQYTTCQGSNTPIPIVKPEILPYNELRTRTPRLRNPLQIYSNSGLNPNLTQNPQGPIVTAANNGLQYISYRTIEFRNNTSDQLPQYVFDNRLFNNEIKFYFRVGGSIYTPNIHTTVGQPPLFIDNENKRHYIFNEIAIVGVRDTLIQSNFNDLFTSSNITTDNFRIYVYKYLDIPLLINEDKIVDIEWSIITYMR